MGVAISTGTEPVDKTPPPSLQQYSAGSTHPPSASEARQSLGDLRRTHSALVLVQSHVSSKKRLFLSMSPAAALPIDVPSSSFPSSAFDDQAYPPVLARIPAPIGGVPAPPDFAPSCLFAVLYGLLVPLALYRSCARKSRNLIVIFSLVVIVERVAFFSTRAAISRSFSTSTRASPAYLAYAQSTLAAGFVSVAKDLVGAVRALLVHEPVKPPRVTLVPAPLPSAHAGLPRLLPVSWIWSRRQSASASLAGPWMTRERERVAYETASVALSLAFLVALALALSSGATYARALFFESAAAQTVSLRYASAGLALALVSVVHVLAYWAWVRNPAAVALSSVLLISAVCTLLSVVGIYRLVVVGLLTDDILSTDAGSLNGVGSKMAFYVFHAAAEWMAIAVLLCANARERFGAVWLLSCGGSA
ncbi:uncharacterized protein BXZ73DRAFT_97701 [Epithele typhae]|uniref:uncharacterized protein n=1 Tax=Epithele typhae TaxID=378194 RepID=UPI0020084842|nr:uncharacterized protein BXZ73DRAFT_97701 [Epithele typhae]KAH9942286.1 hypothetical protein BXZ73DRAFT_97701 [Epithele typhae]